jgi:hypothetical protein
MGITCLDVGGYLNTADETSVYAADMQPCIDPIKGYTPANNVGNHLKLDLDQLESIVAISESNLPLAYKYYSEGNIHMFIYMYVCNIYLYICR